MNVKRGREICEAMGVDAVAGVRNAIGFYVRNWYANPDGTDATPKPDSPAMKVCEAATLLPEALDEIERLRAFLLAAVMELDEHAREYQHVTSDEKRERFRAATKETK